MSDINLLNIFSHFPCLSTSFRNSQTPRSQAKTTEVKKFLLFVSPDWISDWSYPYSDSKNLQTQPPYIKSQPLTRTSTPPCQTGPVLCPQSTAKIFTPQFSGANKLTQHVLPLELLAQVKRLCYLKNTITVNTVLGNQNTHTTVTVGKGLLLKALCAPLASFFHSCFSHLRTEPRVQTPTHFVLTARLNKLSLSTTPTVRTHSCSITTINQDLPLHLLAPKC